MWSRRGVPQLHPEATDDPGLIRWRSNAAAHLPKRIPELTALIQQGVLDRVEVDIDEVRTWLGHNGSWSSVGPTVRTALMSALTSAEHAVLGDDELRGRIEEVVERDVAPIADSHGGGIRVASVQDGVLTVELSGACRGCSESNRTIGELVSRAVQERYPEIREVKADTPRSVWLSLKRPRRAESDPRSTP